ncbi:putative integral to membrane protein [Lyophyllum shimeji]|uniref:Integral to membrane protein n=1 Tax=Lyophyllum shimeji TaxID=47721 RepID=A0A9P3PJ51_LYOSH|nr:putative integral to membrane protein [Lyophyllum shimeji]
MFFSLARLRAAIFSSLLLSTSVAFSREQSLFTSSVTYCEPPETLLIQQFDVAYFAKNQSISFNISAASVQANVNVTANLLLNVYGIRAINITLDLCHILGGALCPLPMYNFTGSDSISLPESLGVQDKIPGIAFKIPDLEGVAQLVLTEVGTGVVKACVQATLSNGWSTHQNAVEWVTGGVALATLLPSIWHSLTPDALLPFRLIDLLLLYQTITSSSFLSLNYPSTYRAFTLNFAWAMGLFSTSPSSSLQSSIDRMRHLTGGKLANSTSASPVGLVNRKLSPYNFLGGHPVVPSPLNRRSIDTFDLSELANVTHTKILSTLASDSATQGGNVQTVTTSSSNVLQAGIPIFVNFLHIATANAFMTIFLCALILIACALGMFALGFAFVYFLGRQSSDRKYRSKSGYPSFVRAWTIRLALVLLSPILVFSFYQWTLKDSWLAILLSVIAFLVLLGALLYPTLLVLRYARHEGREALYNDAKYLASNGALYAQYRVPRFYFFLPLLVVSFLKAIAIAFIKGSGEVQVILMVILEGLTVVSYLVLRPSRTRGSDIFSTFLAIMRLVCTGLMISFVERLNVAPIPRVVIGLVIAVLFSITVLVTYVNLLINSGIERLWTGRSARTSDRSGSTNASIMEKGEHAAADKSSSSEHIGRPNNPTPDSGDQLDPGFLHPFLVSPTETEITSACTSNRTSATMTVGSLLPRRWSLTPLNSPTGSSQAHDPTSYNSHSNHVLARYSDTPPSLRHGQERT